MAGEKTEKATPKRKQDERKKGNVFQSHEIVIVAGLLTGFYALKFLGPYLLTAIEKGIRDFFRLFSVTQNITAADLRYCFKEGSKIFLTTAFPLLLISSLTAVILTLAQTKLLVSFKAVTPKMNRLSPLQGMKKIFSLRGVTELLKAVIKIVLLGAIVSNVFLEYIPTLHRLMDGSVEQAIGRTGEMILSIVQSTAVAAAFVAGFDYLYQWWDYEKNLRMSKQEIKEEYKMTEGDPQIKGKIKERQQQQARRRMMQNVPKADVVIRNPTHFAVAIQYQPEKRNAPVVVAKGMDSLALRIVAAAEKSGVAVMENRPLARGLYESAEIDMEIPETYYQAVAEVLAFVYSLKAAPHHQR